VFVYVLMLGLDDFVMNAHHPQVDVITPTDLSFPLEVNVSALVIIISPVLIAVSVSLNVNQPELWKLVTVHATVLNTLKMTKLARLVFLLRKIAFTQSIPLLLIWTHVIVNVSEDGQIEIAQFVHLILMALLLVMHLMKLVANTTFYVVMAL